MSKKKKPKKSKQPRLPGMEDPHIQEIDDAADEYKSAQLKWSHYAEVAAQSKLNVAAAMRRAGKTTYRCDGLYVVLTPIDDKVSIRYEGPKKAAKKAEKEAAAD